MNTTLCSRIVRSAAALAVCCSPVLASAATVLWIGNPGVSTTTNWSDLANWSGGAPTQNDAIFGGTGAVGTANTIDNVVDTTQHPLSLTFSNGPSQFHTTLIPAGITLTNDNGLTVGGRTADAYTTVVNLVGGGTLIQNGAMTIQNFGAAVSTALATLDMSGLTNFVYTNGASAINVGGTGGNRSAGSLTLAGGSNSITVGTFNVATGSGANAATSSLKLGTGTNIINVGAFNIVNNKNSATLNFFGATGGLRLRGTGGTDADRANFTIANRNQTGTGTATGTLALNGHPVDIKAGTMIVAQNSAGSSANTGTGVVQYDTGILDVTTLNLAVCSNPNASAVANGTVTVGAGGTLVVGSGGVTLVNLTGTTLGTATGNLNINGGSATVGGNIRKATAAGSANLTNSAGTLNMGATANSIGTTAAPIDNLSLTDSHLTLPVVNGLASAVVTTLTVSGTTDTINISSLPGTATFPTQFPLITYGTLNGTFDFVLGTLPGTYQGYISNNAGALSVDLVITNSLTKSDVWNGNVSSNWDTTTLNWLFSGSPANFQQGDFVTFDDSLTGRSNVNMTNALMPGTIAFNNSLSDYVFSGTGKLSGATGLSKQGSASVTLAETGGDDFVGGIIVNNGTLVLDNANSAISGGLTINAGTVQIGNNDGNGALPSGAITDNGALVFKRTNAVTLGIAIPGNGSLAQNGSGTLTVTAANLYTGSTTVSNGTLALTGVGTISNSTQVIINTGTFDISTLTQPTFVTALALTNSTINVSLGASPYNNIVASSLATGGPTNRINVLSLPPIASYPVTFTIIQSAAPADGTFNVGLGTVPVASPPYAASVSQSVDHTAVLLTVTAGPVGVRSFVTWSGADVPNLNTNWSDGLNWQLPGAPVGPETVIFNSTAALGVSALSTPGGGSAALLPENINNIVNNDFTIASLLYTNVGDTYHNTYINPGRKLNITNSLTLGAFDSGASAQHEFVTVSGSTSLNVSNTAANLQVWIGSGSVSGSQATLDLSALDTFNTAVSRLTIGASAINNAVNRPSGILYLAKTNFITAAFQTTTTTNGTTTGNAGIVVADCNGNAGSRSFLYLGQANTLSADTIGIGRQKANATLLFNPIYANTAPFPSVTLRGFSSTRVSLLEVGDSAGNTGTTTLSADADLRGGFVNASVDILTVGRASSGASTPTTTGTTTGSLEFDAGTINANTLNIGFLSAANIKVGIGTVGVGSNTTIGAAATLTVNNVVNLGQTPFGTASTTTSGALNITNGTVFANTIVPGTNSSSTIGMYGGRLFVTNAVGTAATPLATLNLLPSTPDNARNELYLPADGNPSITVNTLNLDEQDTTTNVINVLSVGPVGTPPVEVALIKYTTLSPQFGSTFNIGLGSLPAGYSGYLTNDVDQSMVGLVLTSAVHPRPVMTGVSLSGTNLVIGGTNGFANFPYRVLSSTNVSDPLSTWTVIGSGVFGPTGNFSITTPIAPAVPQRFYSVVVP